MGGVDTAPLRLSRKAQGSPRVQHMPEGEGEKGQQEKVEGPTSSCVNAGFTVNFKGGS